MPTNYNPYFVNPTTTGGTIVKTNGGTVVGTPIAPQGPMGPITPVSPQGPVAPNTPTVNPTNYDVFHMTHEKAIFDYVFQMEDIDVLEHFKEYMQVADIDMPACATVIIDKYDVNELAGTNGDDYIFGLSGNDDMYGNGGDDALFADGVMEWQFSHSVLVGDWDLRDCDLTIDPRLDSWTLLDGVWVPGSDGSHSLIDADFYSSGKDLKMAEAKTQEMTYPEERTHEHELLESGDDIIFGDILDNVLIGDNVHRDYNYDGYRDGRDYDGCERHDIDATYSVKFTTTNTHVETLDILEGHDWLFGMEGDDILVGDSWYENGVGYDIKNDGNDLLNGGEGDDILFGDDGYVAGIDIPESLGVMPTPHHPIDAVASDCTESHDRFPTYENLGNDILIGGEGNDQLYGGHGADKFVFDNYEGVDRVMDFAKEDMIVLTEEMFDVDLADVQSAIDDFVTFTYAGNNSVAMHVDSDGLGGASNMETVAVFHTSNVQFDADDMLNNGQIILGDYL